MSHYSYNEGTITFLNKEEYEATYNSLVEGKWYCEEGQCFLGENDEPLDEYGGKFTPETLQMSLPECTMRNGHRMLLFLTDVKWEGKVLGYSTDGCFDGWIITPKEEKNYDLDDYAKRRDLVVPDCEDDEYYDNVENVVDVWKEEPDWVANSVDFIKN